VTLLAVRTTTGLVVGVGLLGAGIAWPAPVQARFFDQLDDGERGYGFGLIRSAYMLLGSTGSVVVGVLADAGGWVPGFGVLGLALVGSLALLGANRWLDLGL
jgi:MFS family permease